ncbi:MAG: sulfur reduction protein DsrE [Thermodesulfatator sp.]|nr:MAG: sulfur reduction protein DsrE [Thermodesulfatator sp.]
MSETIAGKKLVVVVTHGLDDPEKATLALVVANAALTMDVQVTVVFQGKGVMCCTKGMYEHIVAPGLKPLQELVDNLPKLGAKMFVCIPCIEERKISKEQLVEGCELVKAGKLINEVMRADQVMVY